MREPMRRNERAVFHRVTRLPRQRNFVAAVCYREGEQGLEFLLVRTRSGRWTFPKGGVERGESRSMAAAREAQEEAGVLGHIERKAFAAFQYEKSGVRWGRLVIVEAFLCRVIGTVVPQEDFREPTWFSESQAKAQLAQDRSPRLALELHSVVDLAITSVLWRRTGT